MNRPLVLGVLAAAALVGVGAALRGSPLAASLAGAAAVATLGPAYLGTWETAPRAARGLRTTSSSEPLGMAPPALLWRSFVSGELGRQRILAELNRWDPAGSAQAPPPPGAPARAWREYVGQRLRRLR